METFYIVVEVSAQTKKDAETFAEELSSAVDKRYQDGEGIPETISWTIHSLEHSEQAMQDHARVNFLEQNAVNTLSQNQSSLTFDRGPTAKILLGAASVREILDNGMLQV